jgi:hypothetical protein
MKTKLFMFLGITVIGIFNSCNKELIEYEQGDIKLYVEKGDEWLHNFPLFAGIKMKNPPQLAVWIEDMNGNYVSTIYVTHKAATDSWKMNGGNRRQEALPVWSHARGIKYSDGLYMPTKDEPLVDGTSGATPRESFDVKMRPVGDLKQFTVKIEVNHSTDWNEYYPENAEEGSPNYSGGKEGSGQPAVVYAAAIDLDSGIKQYKASLIGHGSPDGTNGEIYTDMSTLTSALKIVEEITINIQ